MSIDLPEPRALARGDRAGVRGSGAWANEVAKWFAVVVLGLIGTTGLIWSIWFRPMPARLERFEGGAGAASRQVRATRDIEPSSLRPEGSGGGESQATAASVEDGASALSERQDRAPKPALTGTIDINAAGLTELQLLPGIGPALAQRILDDRAKNGPYRVIEDLDRVRGIGPKTLDKLRPLIRVNLPDIPPPP